MSVHRFQTSARFFRGIASEGASALGILVVLARVHLCEPFSKSWCGPKEARVREGARSRYQPRGVLVQNRKKAAAEMVKLGIAVTAVRC